VLHRCAEVFGKVIVASFAARSNDPELLALGDFCARDRILGGRTENDKR
jgi:hypothetical protein